MEWEFFAPMVTLIVLILTAGGVLVLRPIATRLSELLELYASERRQGPSTELQQVRDLLETIEGRLRLVEDRQDFTERLIGSGEGERSGGPDALEARDADGPKGGTGAS